ncbi:MAG: hypothetical protein CM15mP17_08280 [Gammaproteobacteria bacterium]|nr:MAG: hypothetical protein CM15mP17_08280 [Gammaproteobacteria bacterium]
MKIGINGFAFGQIFFHPLEVKGISAKKAIIENFRGGGDYKFFFENFGPRRGNLPKTVGNRLENPSKKLRERERADFPLFGKRFDRLEPFKKLNPDSPLGLWVNQSWGRFQ